jgi:hypothetical protein
VPAAADHYADPAIVRIGGITVSIRWVRIPGIIRIVAITVTIVARIVAGPISPRTVETKTPTATPAIAAIISAATVITASISTITVAAITTARVAAAVPTARIPTTAGVSAAARDRGMTTASAATMASTAALGEPGRGQSQR